MSIPKEAKSQIIQSYAIKENDTGSAEVIIAILTQEIRILTEHFKIHKKDNHSRLGMMKKIGKRGKLMRWLKSQSEERYKSLINKLNIRG